MTTRRRRFTARAILRLQDDLQRLLATMAEQETEGNESMMLRRLIREGAERRGFFVAQAVSHQGHYVINDEAV